MKANKLLFFMLFCFSIGFAQSYDIGGTVKDGSGMPLPGANVKIKNSQTGTVADIDGNFTLKAVPANATVVFSYLGFKDFEFKATSSNSGLSITLQEDTSTLDEIVVIGYGGQKKKDVTGSVGIVTGETIEKLKPMQASQALQGTVAGVSANISNGAPGAETVIRIRGVGSNIMNKPLVIIDGFIGNMDDINYSDIETMTVLKDAQAAIYGTIGANGVVLITSKTGKRNQKGKITYNGYTGFQETSRKLPLLNATEYAVILNESYGNNGQALPYPNVSGLGKGTNWQNEVFQTVPIMSHDISFSGGTEKVSYSVSGSHFDQDGIVGGGGKSKFLRNTARIQLEADVTDRLKISTNVNYRYQTYRTLNTFALGSILFNALNAPPTLTPFDDETGAYTQFPGTGLGNEIINPLPQIDNTFNEAWRRKIFGTFGLTYKLYSDLTLTSRIGFNSEDIESKSFSPIIEYGSGKVFNNPRSSVTQGAINENDYSFDIFLDYKKSIAEAHNLTVTLGNTIYRKWDNSLFGTGYDILGNSWANADIKNATGLPPTVPVSSGYFELRRLSYFGRLQYDFKGKYLLSGMIRRDMSTMFGPNERVAWFPSATAGWVASEESFLKDKTWINFLKIRASYGELGNDAVGGPSRYTSLLVGEGTYIFDNVINIGRATGPIPNANVAWERVKKLDIGLDANFLSNKLSLTADYFVDIRDGLLINPLPVSGIHGGGAPGSSYPAVNAGESKNYGVELALGYKNKVSENFSIDVNYNVTFLKNKVTRVDNGTGFMEAGAFGVGQPAPARMQVGQPLGAFFGYVTDGIFQNAAEVAAHPSQLALGAEAQPGDIRFKDMNGDGVININDRAFIGDPIPSAMMGFNISMNYKGLDLAVQTFAQLGHDIVRNYERTQTDVNRLDYVLDRWTGPGTSNTVPRVTTGATSNNVFSDYFLEDGSFARIQRVELGYSLDKKFTERAGVSKARIYAGVNNVWTFTKYRGYDPAATTGEAIGGGIDYGFYPLPRTFSVGVNLTF